MATWVKAPAGGVSRRHTREEYVLLGVGVVAFAWNHLAVVFLGGVRPEALIAGAWLTLIGLWTLALRQFPRLKAWVDRSEKRMFAAGLLSVALSVAFADLVARAAYGESIFG
jgi:hypothetical protein